MSHQPLRARVPPVRVQGGAGGGAGGKEPSAQSLPAAPRLCQLWGAGRGMAVPEQPAICPSTAGGSGSAPARGPARSCPHAHWPVPSLGRGASGRTRGQGTKPSLAWAPGVPRALCPVIPGHRQGHLRGSRDPETPVPYLYTDGGTIPGEPGCPGRAWYKLDPPLPQIPAPHPPPERTPSRCPCSQGTE